MQILTQAVTVKNAYLMKYNDGDLDLQHYETIILSIRNYKAVSIKPVSVSSRKAIDQALTYLGFPKNRKEIVKDLEAKGEFVPNNKYLKEKQS